MESAKRKINGDEAEIKFFSSCFALHHHQQFGGGWVLVIRWYRNICLHLNLMDSILSSPHIQQIGNTTYQSRRRGRKKLISIIEGYFTTNQLNNLSPLGSVITTQTTIILSDPHPGFDR